ncbi:MAG: cytochrome P450 [Actinomycetota bacterium]|nr:cytochrome P450 [Actinomycetota bacterium]
MTDTVPGRAEVHYDRHTPDHRLEFEAITDDLQQRCPVAWTETYGGHWVISDHKSVFELARDPHLLSSDNDPEGERKGYLGIGIPPISGQQTGILEMDPPYQKEYRSLMNPYLSPAAVARWAPMVADLTRACLDEKIESGSIDFVDDLANIVPAVMTMALMGLPLADWVIYCEPAHATIYTPPHSPDLPRVLEAYFGMMAKLGQEIEDVRQRPRPGLVHAFVTSKIGGQTPSDTDIRGQLSLLIGGGFDTTTSLTAKSLDWLSNNPGERDRLAADLPNLINSATEEFLRFYTPAPGDGRTVTQDCEYADQQLKEGDRLWLSWAMANRDPSVFPDPHKIKLDRTNNRHSSFGLGIHRCIGSNVARAIYKTMLTQVLERMPDFVCDSERAVHYETVGVINGMQHLPATFTSGPRLGDGLDATIARWQARCDTEGLAAPIVTAATT